MLKFFALSLALFLSACSDPKASDGAPVVSGAWVRTAPPSANVLAGYMTLSNPSNDKVRIVAAESELFDAIEFHSMDMRNGQMLMKKMMGVEAPAGQRARLKPGSDHLMLIGPKQRLAAGQRVMIVFTLDTAGVVSKMPVTFLVRDRAPSR